jgi:hypothetical protein
VFAQIKSLALLPANASGISRPSEGGRSAARR